MAEWSALPTAMRGDPSSIPAKVKKFFELFFILIFKILRFSKIPIFIFVDFDFFFDDFEVYKFRVQSASTVESFMSDWSDFWTSSTSAGKEGSIRQDRTTSVRWSTLSSRRP